MEPHRQKPKPRSRLPWIVGALVVFIVLMLVMVNRPVAQEISPGVADAGDVVASSTEPVEEDQAAQLRDELLNQFDGEKLAVVVVDLNGGGRDFTLNPDEVFIAASTYKLFVAVSMAQAVADGAWAWTSRLADTTLADCFERMITVSDNVCPEAWLDQATYTAVTQEAHNLGAADTDFTGGDMTTTARDLATVLQKVYNGSAMSSAATDRLLDAMKRQVFRTGIPAGVGADVTVADKVGFLDGYLHDAGIVYGDKGDFVFVILTENSDWAEIARLATTLYDWL
jgi:beta-lactamase class A